MDSDTRLVGMINSDNDSVRYAAFLSLAKNEGNIAYFILALEDSYPENRKTGLNAIAAFENPEHIGKAVALFDDNIVEVRCAAVKAVSAIIASNPHMDGKPIILPLIDVIDDTSWSIGENVIDAAKFALKLIKEPAIEFLESNLIHGTQQMKVRSVHLLGEIGCDPGILIRALLEEDDRVRKEALNVLVEKGTGCSHRLREELKSVGSLEKDQERFCADALIKLSRKKPKRLIVPKHPKRERRIFRLGV